VQQTLFTAIKDQHHTRRTAGQHSPA
jgi:hypothetical protein